MRATTGLARRAMSTADGPEPIKTALYDWHVKRGGKMVPFAGYWLPVLYEV
jgi:aminomethyltransferase